ncbi:MAG: radical SAM protein [Candidatus Nanoarchaeia archaeon]
MKNTNFDSYSLNGIAKGCKECLKGRKAVLFISGICSRNCKYCSLSKKRKNKDIIWVNERECSSTKEMIKEAKESNATSAGITGGDPFLRFERTIEYAARLKKEFGKNFHIHIYLPTQFSSKEKLKRLSEYIDEVRFHADIFNYPNKEKIIKEIEKIKEAREYFKKQNIGIELPMIPNKKELIFDFIKKASPYIGFVNLNEFEIGDTNFDYVTNNYKLNDGGYTVKDSIKSGLWILRQCEKEKIKLKIHLCTAKTKNWHQYRNRLKRHSINKYGIKTKDGTVVYFCLDKNKLNDIEKISKECYIDKDKKRIVISVSLAKKLVNLGFKVKRIEECPTYERDEVEIYEIEPKE